MADPPRDVYRFRSRDKGMYGKWLRQEAIARAIAAKRARKKANAGKGKGKGKGKNNKKNQKNISVDFRVDDWQHLPADAFDATKEIYGHCICIQGSQLWSIGGTREGQQGRHISLLRMDLHTKCWNDLTPPYPPPDPAEEVPSWRWGHSSVLVPTEHPPKPDSQENYLMICGGFDKETNMNDVWFFNTGTGKFFTTSNDEEGVVPVVGAYHALAYDAATDYTYLFGGQKCIRGAYEYYDSLYRYSMHSNFWSPLDTRGSRPPPRGQAAAAISKRVLVVHGGSNRYKLLRDVWILKLDTSALHWSEVKIQPGPSMWIGHKQKAMPYHIAPCRPFLATAENGVLVLGRGKPKGQHPGPLSLWALSLWQRRWRRVPVQMAPDWSGNFAAAFNEGGQGSKKVESPRRLMHSPPIYSALHGRSSVLE